MASELNALLDELEARIEALKIQYERYFLGLEKLEPLAERKGVERMVRHLQTAQTKNTAIRFRTRSLNQRFISYQSYWNRICRQIEAGTYHRDLAKVERDMKRRGIDVCGLSKMRSKGELEAALIRSLAEAEKQASSQPDNGNTSGRKVRDFTPEEKAGLLTGEHRIASTTAPPPIPPQAKASSSRCTGGESTGSRPDERMRRLYKAYVAAKRRTGESTEGLTYDRLVRTLQRQVPAIQAKTGCRRVDFKIQIQGGKAILKAVPIK